MIAAIHPLLRFTQSCVSRRLSIIDRGDAFPGGVGHLFFARRSQDGADARIPWATVGGEADSGVNGGFASCSRPNATCTRRTSGLSGGMKKPTIGSSESVRGN